MSSDTASESPASAETAQPVQTLTLTLGEALHLGRTLHESGVLFEAKNVYLQILDAKPDQPEALHFLGVLAHQDGHSDYALELIGAALTNDPGYADAHNNLGNVLMALGRYDEAEASYRRAIELRPDFADPHNNLAAVYNALGRHEEALVECRRAIELSPNLPEADLAAARELAAKGEAGEAVREYLIAMALKRFHSSAYANLAITLYKMKRFDDAADVYRRWLAYEPNAPKARHQLAALTGEDVPPRASDDFIRQTFDGFAQSFDKQLEFLKYCAPQLVADGLSAALGEAAPRYDVLDAGCGTGLCGPLVRPYARRLVGVDLSPRMLQKAAERKAYDELVEAELTAFIAAASQSYDAIISADTLCYFGDLSAVIRAAAGALKPGGWFVFTVEKAEPAGAPGGFKINRHGRYSHTGDYLRDTLVSAGFAEPALNEHVLRFEWREPVVGWLVRVRSKA